MKRSVIIFVFLSTFASAINYATYPFLGRILPAQQYVDITVSLSLLTQITTFLSSVVAITIGLSKSEPHGGTNEKIELLQSTLFKLFLLLDGGFLIFSPAIMGHIHTPTIFAIPIALMMLVSVPIATVSGYLNGRGLMIKLGVLGVTAAGFQFVIGVGAAWLTRNGFIAMLLMTLTQLAAIVFIYWLFKTERLPRILEAFKKPVRIEERQYLSKLLTFTVLASLAIMAINLVQIADLLIIQTLHTTNIKFYTDIYVISRVVFFAGAIFIWPFLGEIDIDSHHLNRGPFAKAIGFFTIITFSAMAALYFFGPVIARVLFGAHYSLSLVRNVALLSVLYKFFFLIITAVTLYFVVIRSYVSVWLALSISFAILIYSEIASKYTSIHSVLVRLDLISGVVAALAILLLIFRPIKKPV